MRLESIRNRSGLLMVVIGVAMFAFIMMDLMSSQRSGGTTDLVVGEVNGEEIDLQTFELKFQERSSNSNNTNIEQIRNTTWTQLVRELVFQKQFEELGIAVGSDELFDMIQGTDPNPSVRQTFVDSAGNFDRALLLQYLKEDMYNDETGQSKARWVMFEQAIAKEKLQQKYNALINKGVFVSSKEAQLYYNAQNEMRSVSYISIPFKTLADSLVEVTDGEMNEYLQENANLFQQNNSRSIEYVVFSVRPSKEDDITTREWMQDIKSDFEKVEDNASFVKRFSDNPANLISFVTKEKLPAIIATEIESTDLNTVYGPYKSNQSTYQLAKLVAFENRADSVKARHILVSGNNANAQIDSLKNAIRNGANFSDVAKAKSQDKGSAEKGGDLGWFTEGVMVQSFNDACFEGIKGELQVVESPFGIHLIEVTNKSAKSKKYKVAYLNREVVAGNQTYQTVFTSAGKFAAETNNADDFNSAITEGNLTKRLADGLNENANTIPGLDNPRQLVRWAYEANVGEVSDVFEFGDKFVVAHLTDIKEEGLQSLEDVRSRIESTLLQEKKSALLIDQLTGATDLDLLASDFGATVKSVEGITFFSSQVPGVGSEPAFVGMASAMSKGDVSRPVKGMNSIFVLRLDDVISAPEGATGGVQQQLQSSLQSRSGFEVYNELEKLANVKDNRAKFY
ncbi:MAG: hypothetical protein CMP75_02855 [Flavobacteriales bacterium]|nr:hypothetical protein [Flavobacteriales bacterium]